MKKIFILVLITIMITGIFASCQNKVTTESSLESLTEEKSSSEEKDTSSDTFIFTDSVGREVEIPKNIERIAPTGPMAQVVLYTIASEKMVGSAAKYSDEQKKYVKNENLELPVLGNLYADTLNTEALLLANPQIIIDIGEIKESAKEDLDRMQELTGIPTIFIEMYADDMSTAYETLGTILNLEDKGNKLAKYAKNTLADAKEKSKKISVEEKKSIYFASEEGLTTFVADTVHTEIIDIINAKNVSEIESSVRGGLGEINMEQLLLWNPDIILLAPNGIYDTISETEEWLEVSAVQNKTYYEVPMALYSWMNSPSSVNRIIGIKWLGNLVYPDAFDYDMIKETKEFYSLFYDYEISDEEINEILANSTLK